MDFRLFLVMTLICVHASAQIQGENSTIVAGFNSTNTSTSESPVVSKTSGHQTTEATFNVNTTFIPQDTSSVPSSKSPDIERTTKESTPAYDEYTTKQSSERPSNVANSMVVDTTTKNSNKINFDEKLSTESTAYLKDETSTTGYVDKQHDVTTASSEQETTTTIMADGTPSTVKVVEIDITTIDTKEKGSTSTESAAEKSATDMSPGEFFKWLDSLEPRNQTNATVTEQQETNNNIEASTETTDINDFLHDHGHDHHHSIDPERMPPKEFFEWLDSIHPNVTTVKNIIDTSIISTEKLIIVVSTICGTFVLFVAILIAISCCRRKRNLRNDSEKSDFSMNSVISIPEKRNSCNSDIFSSDKNNGFNNVFMGIPANNEVWKKLDQLPPTAPAVMPESTKM